MTAVDRPPTAFKKSVADEWVVPWVSNANWWLEDVSGWQIGVLGSFPARRSLSAPPADWDDRWTYESASVLTTVTS